MDQFVLGPIFNFDFEDDIRIPETNVNIIKNNKLIEELVQNPNFLMNVGAINIKHLLSTELHFSQHRIPSEHDVSPMQLISLQKYMVQTFLFSLWLVKDNAVNSGNFYWRNAKSHVITDSPVILFSNSKGEYERTTFSFEEINSAKELQGKVIKYSKVDSGDKEQFTGEEGQINNFNKHFPYPNDRISRSLRLITIARSQSFLPAKISSYISSVEALISSSRESLSMQVSERVPKIIGGSAEEKIINHDKLKAAYNIRSKFVHGDRISDNLAAQIENGSADLDDLVRKLLVKVINEYDEIAEYNENALTKWYKENLMF
jgi:hypothetical protein